MGCRVGILKSTKGHIKQFHRRVGDNQVSSLHKLMSLDIEELCLAISKHVLVDMPTTEDVGATREDSCDSVYQGQFSVRVYDLRSHHLQKLLKSQIIYFLKLYH